MQCSEEEIRYFTIDNPEHELELKHWCRFHYLDTIKKGIENCNIVFYHDCCFCFSRRSFCKKAGHPVQMTYSILRVPGLKNVASAEELYIWVKGRMVEHRDNGRLPIFPAVNRHHQEMDFNLQTSMVEQMVDFLTKKAERLREEKEAYMREIEKLREDNSKLQASSKNWMRLYHNTMRQESEDDFFFKRLELPPLSESSTPRKKTNFFSSQ